MNSFKKIKAGIIFFFCAFLFFSFGIANAVEAVNGTCGPSHEQSYSSAPSTPSDLCNTGTPGTVYESGSYSWLWACAGSGGGTSAGCYALQIVNGACGSSDGESFTVKPSTGLCTAGTASSVSGTGPWTWTCTGINGGTTDNCSASVGAGSSSSWYPGWEYRKPIVVSNSSGSDLTNYQIKVTVAYDSDMQADFDDIRFTLDDNTLLNYWLESKTDSSTATFWVKVLNIPTDGTAIYMYYGNSSATSLSNGDDTFEFFDSFDSAGGLNSEKWTTSGGYSTTITVSSSQLSLQEAGSSSAPWLWLKSVPSFGTGYSVRTRLQTNASGYYAYPGQRGSQLYFEGGAMYAYGATDLAGKYYNTASDTQSITGFSASTWFIQDISRNSTTSRIYKINDNNTVTISTGVSTSSGQVQFGLYAYTDAGTISQTIDWVLVRKFVGTEPTNAVGSEEQLTGSSSSWYSTWAYRQPVTISNASGIAQTNYQVKVTVPYNAHMQADFDDIRFTLDDNTLLNYWLESKTDSSTATFWVKVPTISTSGATIYMYYGKSSASSLSNGSNTFDLFDHFEGSSVDAGKWTTIAGTPAVASSVVTLDSGAEIRSLSSFGTNYAIRAYAAIGSTASYNYLRFYGDDNNSVYFYKYSSVIYLNNKSGGTVSTNRSFGSIYNVYHTWDLIRNGSTSVIGIIETGTTYSNATYIPTGNEYIDIMGHTTGRVDWVLVRKYIASEPAATLGTESASAVCGSAHGQYSSSAPTSNLCTIGTASSVFGSNPYTWTCTGAEGTVASCSTAGPWYSTSWPYRQPITISNSSGSDLTDYQVKVTVPYNAHIQADFDDIRFVLNDNVTVLSYWLESKTDYATATFWVKVSSIPTAGTTIYVYYGNASATSISSGDNTFVLYDHFTGTSIDTSKWQSGSACAINAGAAAYCYSDTSAAGLYSLLTYGNGYAIQASAVSCHMGATTYYEEPLSLSASGSAIYFRAATSTGSPPKYGNYNGSFSEVAATGWSTGTWHTIELKRLSTGAYWTIDGANSVSNTSYYSSANMYVGFDAANIGATGSCVQVDLIFIRKVVATEPTNTLGTEETITAATCGASHSQILSSAPTTNLCSAGTASSVSGTGPWTWTCTSPDKLTTVSCYAAKSGSNWLAGWQYRKSISISSSSNLTDYQIKLAVTYSNSSMKSDFSDLRFTDSGYTTLLNYWIESYTASTSAVVWVKVPSISTSGTTIYMYYGNSAASTASSGDNTFEFFDDFNSGTSVDTNKWTVNSGQTNSITSGILKVLGANDTNDNIVSKSTFGIGYAVRSLSQFANRSTTNFWGFGDMTDGAVYSDSASQKTYTSKSGTSIGDGTTVTAGIYYIYEVMRIATDSTQYYIDNAWWCSVPNSSYITTASLPIKMREYSNGYYQNHNWLLVRKIVASEPINTINSEESGIGAACGTSNGQSLSSAPTTNLCTAGTASSVSNSGLWAWSWTCTSADVSSSISCAAIKTGASWLTGWNYRRSISITNGSGSNVTDYQIKIAVTGNSHMANDFRDLSFTNSSHSAILDYWIESYTAGSSAVVWVKVPSISTSGATIYMYYGNDLIATGASSGDETFAFFDHFSGASVDTNKWSIITQTPTVASSVLTLNATAGAEVRSIASFGTNYALRAYASLGTYSNYNYVRFYGDASNMVYFYKYSSAVYFTNKSGGTVGTSNSAGAIYSAYHIYDIMRNGSTSVSGVVDNSATYTNTTYIPTGSEYVDFMGRTSTLVDWVLVRKYIASEPTNTINNEETYNVGVNGLCGSANGTTPSTVPTTNLCTSGTASSVATGATTYSWNCLGINGGTTASCYANKSSTIVNGKCGVANYVTVASAPTTDLCTSGTPSSVTTNASTYTWTCSGVSEGTDDSCEANKSGSTVAGSCGTSHNQNFTSAPTTNLCATSNGAPTVSGTGPWTWSCFGSSTPTGDVSCSANKALPKWHEESPY